MRHHLYVPEAGPGAKRAWMAFPAVGFGVVTAVGALSHGSIGTAIAQGVFAGAAFGVLWIPTMLIFFGRRDRKARERLGEPAKGVWDPVSVEKTLRVSIAPDDAFARLVEGVKSVGKARLTSTDRRRRRVTAKVGMTRASWGERLVAEVRDSPTGTVVTIASTPVFRFTVVDQGKNLANVERVVATMGGSSEDRSGARQPPARSSSRKGRATPGQLSSTARVVLYESAGQWRFAYTTARGDITEGRVGRSTIAPSAAQQTVEARLRKHGVEVRGPWQSDAEGWWTADVVPIRHT